MQGVGIVDCEARRFRDTLADPTRRRQTRRLRANGILGNPDAACWRNRDYSILVGELPGGSNFASLAAGEFVAQRGAGLFRVLSPAARRSRDAVRRRRLFRRRRSSDRNSALADFSVACSRRACRRARRACRRGCRY